MHHDRWKLFEGNFSNWLQHDLGDDTGAPDNPTSKSDPEMTNLISNGRGKTVINSDSEEDLVYTRFGHLSRCPTWFSY